MIILLKSPAKVPSAPVSHLSLARLYSAGGLESCKQHCSMVSVWTWDLYPIQLIVAVLHTVSRWVGFWNCLDVIIIIIIITKVHVIVTLHKKKHKNVLHGLHCQSFQSVVGGNQQQERCVGWWLLLGWDPRARQIQWLPVDSSARAASSTQAAEGDPNECCPQCPALLQLLRRMSCAHRYLRALIANIVGYWRQRADSRVDNHPPR